MGVRGTSLEPCRNERYGMGERFMRWAEQEEEVAARLIGTESEAGYGSLEPNSQRWTDWNRQRCPYTLLYFTTERVMDLPSLFPLKCPQP